MRSLVVLLLFPAGCASLDLGGDERSRTAGGEATTGPGANADALPDDRNSPLECAADRSNGCGNPCDACVAPPNASATCAAGACGFTCNAGYIRAGSSCVEHATKILLFGGTVAATGNTWVWDGAKWTEHGTTPN